MNIYSKTIQVITTMKPNEQKAAITSFFMVFILMAVYFILRPVRDAMASDWTDTEVSILWNIQFFLSIAIVGLYSYLITKIRFKWVVPLVYAGFALSFFAFYCLSPLFTNPTLLEKSFYLWVTAFSLLNLSVFWSFMSDTFNQEQSKRLFAFIGAGASAGAIVGPAIPTLFAAYLGLENLMLIAAVGLMLVVPFVFYLNHLKHVELGNANLEILTAEDNIGGKWWSGFRDVVRNRYLLGIAGFILLYVFISSFVYFEQKNLLAEYSRADRAEILGGIDWVVNSLTFVFAFFITSRLVNNMGMGIALALVPMALIIGFLALAFAPMIIILLAVQVVRRVGNYSVTRPAREMLFTNVSTEERFKAKPVIDVVVYRGGDAVSSTLFALLTDGLGIGLVAVSLIGSGLAAMWASLGIYLGKQFKKTASDGSRVPLDFTQNNKTIVT